jgi:outer membrane lipoprotein SlyB
MIGLQLPWRGNMAVHRALVIAVANSGLLLTGCSSRPRSFAPVSSVAVQQKEAFESAWLSCRADVASRTDQKSGRVASAIGGVAVGAGATAAVGTAAAGTYATIPGAMAAGAATLAVAPLALVGGAWAISKIKKNRKEKAIKVATADCMRAAGYPVESWDVLSKREARALDAAAASAPPPRPQ